MWSLIISPGRFFRDKKDTPEDLSTPLALQLVTSGFAFGSYYSISHWFTASAPPEMGDWIFPLLLISGILSGAAILVVWPLATGILAATGIVLWGRDADFRKFLELVGWALFPHLVHGAFVFSLLMAWPLEAAEGIDFSRPGAIEDHLRKETVLRVAVPASKVAALWCGWLLGLAVQVSFSLSLVRSLLTVLVPVLLYEGLRWGFRSLWQ